MSKSPCILCHHGQTTITEEVRAADLSALYKRNLGVETHFPSDLYYHHCPACDLRYFTCEDGSIPTGDNAFYNALNQLEWYYFSEKHEYHYAQSFIKGESAVLEVGCGKGAFAHFLTEEAREKYVGLEFSTEAKKMAAQNGITIENISIEDYAKSHAGGFDIACSFQVLEHVSDPYSFLEAQIRCLKSPQARAAQSRQESSLESKSAQRRESQEDRESVEGLPEDSKIYDEALRRPSRKDSPTTSLGVASCDEICGCQAVGKGATSAVVTANHSADSANCAQEASRLKNRGGGQQIPPHHRPPKRGELPTLCGKWHLKYASTPCITL